MLLSDWCQHHGRQLAEDFWLQVQFGVHVRTLFRLPWQLSTVFDGAWRDLICPCRWVDDSHRQRRMYSGWISLIFYKGTGVMYKHVFEIWITRLIYLFGKNPAWYIGIVQVGSQIFWIYHMIFYPRFSSRVFTAMWSLLCACRCHGTQSFRRIESSACQFRE